MASGTALRSRTAQLLAQTLTSAGIRSSVVSRSRRATHQSTNNVWTSGASTWGWKTARLPGERVLERGQLHQAVASFTGNAHDHFHDHFPAPTTVVQGTLADGVGLPDRRQRTCPSWTSAAMSGSGTGPHIKLHRDRHHPHRSALWPADRSLFQRWRVRSASSSSIRLLSQPILVQLVTGNDTLFNQNPTSSDRQPVESGR